MPVIKPLSVNLSEWSHIKIGTECSDFYLPESLEQLLEMYDIAAKINKKVLLLAGGSNILFGKVDDYIVVSDARLPSYWRQEGKEIIVSGNYNITRLLMKIARLDLGGLEFLGGIPAHIAGLVRMNAGAFGSQIADYIKFITIIDQHKSRVIPRADINFSYRHSNITGCITEIRLAPEIVPYKEILTKIKANILTRSRLTPINLPNLGSIFKNPQDASAGYLLDKAGFRGKRLGDAAFSSLHANIMVNLGKATFSDAWSLITAAREKVKKDFNINLKLEIEVVN
ncbi:MAG: UDP-N-acetylmuramate dehydrogenase [Candidatus Cloacimonetes bacterium]|nr:UDP-N-acetylmuramate dehydrogenase [Candidatus Cloacimonadota bacterium]